MVQTRDLSQRINLAALCEVLSVVAHWVFWGHCDLPASVNLAVLCEVLSAHDCVFRGPLLPACFTGLL